MAVVMSMARRFLAAACKDPVTEYINRGKITHLFKNTEKDDFKQFDAHVRKHAAMPSTDLLNEWWDSIPKTPEPSSFYFEQLTNRHFESALGTIVSEANELVQQDKSRNAAELIMAKLAPEILRSHGNRLIEFSDAYDLVAANYYQQMKQGDDYGVKMGYPVVDDFGGLVAGDMVSIAGRPAAGKSFLQLRGALKAHKQKKRSGFLSMEMNNLISGQRLVAMDAQIPLNGLKLQKGQGLTSAQMLKLRAASKAAKAAENPFFLLDGNLSTTVEDIYNFCRHMKLDVLFIDGAYMLKHPNPRLGRFERVAENCELLKQEIAGNLGIPVVASWQLSRDAAKKMNTGKKPGATNNSSVGLEDIGYSDAIGQISSIVLGLLDEETIETMMRKRVTVMKGRGGETGEFWINWIFNPTLNFDAWQETDVSEMSFL